MKVMIRADTVSLLIGIIIIITGSMDRVTNCVSLKKL